MALKDIGKIVANQTAKERFEAEEQNQRTPKVSIPAVDIKPGTSKPADVSGHVGFKYDSANPFHKDILKTLLNNNTADVVIHEGGFMSIPKKLAYEPGISTKFETASKLAGGEVTFGEATKLAPRKSEGKRAPATRPAPPKNTTRPVSKKTVAPNNTANNIKEEMRNIFSGADVRVDPEVEARKKAEAAKAEETERKARRKEAKRRLREG